MKNKKYALHQPKMVYTLKEMVSQSKTLYSNDLAFWYERNNQIEKKTFTDLEADINAVGTYFYHKGWKNEKIALVGENSYEWILTYFAAVNGGNVIVPLDKELKPEELTALLNASGAPILVYSKSKEKFLDQIRTSVPDLKEYLCIDDFPSIIHEGKRMIEEGNHAFSDYEIDRDQMCAIIYTSGTTGTPKGVMLSHRNLICDCIYSQKNLAVPRDTVLVLPLNHTFGMMAGVICQISLGNSVYLNNSLKKVLSDIQRAKPHHIALVPLFIETFYKSIWRNAEKQGKAKMLRKMIRVSNALQKVGIDLRRVFFKSVLDAFGGNLSVIISGGAPIDELYMDGFRDIGITIINGYGITECSPIVATNREKWIKYGSVGCPIPHTEVKIKNPNENGEGEICIKGEIVTLGYYQNEEANRASFDGEWFQTGDIGRIDADGFLFITGRKKNMILLSNGKNVYPEELEALLLFYDDITETIVFCENDKIVAEIYSDVPGAEENIRKEVQEVNEKLAGYQRIREVRFRDTEFEKTATKKIKR